MNKIGSFIAEMDQLLGIKTAFVPAPPAPGSGGGGGGAVGGGQQQGGAPQQGAGDPQQLQQQVGQMLQSLPPEVQKQIAPQLQQIQQLPPEQQAQGLQQIMQGMQQMQQGGQGGSGQPAPGTQGAPQGGDPGQQAIAQGQDPNAAATGTGGATDPTGHVNAENQMDSTKITLSVRELNDLMTQGKATKSLLAVKQMAHSHNHKMQQDQQKMQQDQQKQQMEAQMNAQTQQAGGLYAAPPDMSGKSGGGAPQQPSAPGGM